METFCGIDWADDHHDVAVIDRDGQVLAHRQIRDDHAGLQELLELLSEHGDRPDRPVPVAIETSRGLLVAALRATRPVHPINPLAAAHYRTRTALSGRKSDRADAVMLANILRTDRHEHRPLPVDSEQVQALSVLARAQQEAVWDRTDVHNKLRALLKEFYPAMLQVVAGQRGGLLRPEVRTLLLAASTPSAGARLTIRRITAALRRAGRERHLEHT